MRRLLEAAEYPIILIAAPAGFGKTTAIRQFLARCENPIFISTPQPTSNLSRFIRAFSEGCCTFVPAMSTPPSELSEEALSSELELELHTAWAIANLRTVPCTIAIDDLQHADGDPRVAAFLSKLTDNCGDQIQWLFSSRTQGLLPRSSWQAYARADATINADDLRMDEDEAAELASNWSSNVSREQLSNWVTQTQGFPIPLTYAIRASSRRGNIDQLTDGMRGLTFNFLAEHLWQALQNDERALLEFAALLPSIQVHDYEYFGIDRAGAKLASLTDDIAFISLNAASVFLMHDLFRDFVRQQILARGISGYRQVAQQAAGLLLESGRPLDGLQLLVDIGDISALLSAIESSPIQLDNFDFTPALVASIERQEKETLNLGALLLLTNYWTRRGSAANSLLYAEELLRRPEATSHHLLCAVRTISRFTHYRSAQSHRTWLNRIPAILDRLDKSDYTQALAFQANYCCRFPELIGDAKRQLGMILRDLQYLSPLDRFDVLMVNAVTFLVLDDQESALKSTREALSDAQTLGDSREAVRALNALGMILYMRCDSEFEVVSEQVRHMVAKHGAWRFSQTSHWIPAEYYARCGNSQRSLEASEFFNEVILADDTVRRWMLHCRRTIMIQISLIDKRYAHILADFARLGLPEPPNEQYEIALAISLAHSFLGDEVRATQHLAEARAFREKMTNSWQKAGVFDVYYGEVIALCSVGRWTQAKRLMSQHGEKAAGTPVLYSALMSVCDGPPFAGVASALQPFVGKPYVGLLALLASRVVEKWSAPQIQRPLSVAETDVLRLIGLGRSNKDIASTRSRSLETVKRQVASLYRKLGVDNRTSAVAIARERGLL